jgi:hypothetical protein
VRSVLKDQTGQWLRQEKIETGFAKINKNCISGICAKRGQNASDDKDNVCGKKHKSLGHSLGPMGNSEDNRKLNSELS